jgi:CBS-domain-containing membrane protein
MTDYDKYAAKREAAASAVTHFGPTADRYNSALERYLSAVANADEHAAHASEAPHGDLYWNIENNRVVDVMTRTVVAVSTDTPFKEVVDALARNRVSAVPVIDAQRRVLGIVSESDLLAKVVTGGDPRVRVEGGRATRAQARRKSHAETAGELMTSPAVTTRPDVSIVTAARTAAREHVRRMPVVDGSGALVGMVTRSDLLRVFRRDDEEIRAHLTDDLLARQFGLDLTAVRLVVHDGIVTLSGQVERRMLIAPLLDAVRATAGVVGVHDELTYRVDDTILPAPKSPPY